MHRLIVLVIFFLLWLPLLGCQDSGTKEKKAGSGTPAVSTGSPKETRPDRRRIRREPRPEPFPPPGELKVSPDGEVVGRSAEEAEPPDSVEPETSNIKESEPPGSHEPEPKDSVVEEPPDSKMEPPGSSPIYRER